MEKKYNLAVSVSKHELGHWFAAKEFGFKEDHISILFQYSYNGNINHYAYSQSYPYADLYDLNSVYIYVTRRIICLQSGVVSEFMDPTTGVVDIPSVEQAIKGAAANDYKQISELANIARGIKFSGEILAEMEEKQIKEIVDECWHKAVRLIHGKIPVITSMAQKMGNQLMTSDNGMIFEYKELQALMYDEN